MRWSKLIPSPAMAVSLVALTVALGGTSYAAAKIGNDDIRNGAVQSKQIKNKTIKAKDIKAGSVKSWNIDDGTIAAKDLRPGVIPTPPKATRWLLINAAGQIEAQSGGFSIVAAYPTLPNTAPDGSPSNALRANGNVYINSGEDLSDNGFVASVALQNTVDQDGGGMAGRTAGADANAEFSGEISVSQCGTTITACAPPGAANVTNFVVSPRMSDGQPTNDTNRKRFYVLVTG